MHAKPVLKYMKYARSRCFNNLFQCFQKHITEKYTCTDEMKNCHNVLTSAENNVLAGLLIAIHDAGTLKNQKSTVLYMYSILYY